MSKNSNKSWLEISQDNLFSNLKEIRKCVGPKVKVLAIVKSNAYGHGLVEITNLLKNKVDYFGVDNIDEALKIRSHKIKTPILVIGYVPKPKFEKAAEKNISIALYNYEDLAFIKNLKPAKPLRVHLKIETGMNRQGIKLQDLPKFINFIKKNKDRIILDGVYTHLADSDDLVFTNYQLKNFQETIKLLEESGLNNLLKHCSASAGIFSGKKFHFNFVRTGISLYGYWNSPKIKERGKNYTLKPVLTFKSVVAQVKTVKKNETVGYGRTWKAKKDTTIAIIPVGYYDGFDRRLSNCGEVLIKNHIAKVIGRVAMNMFMIDVTKIAGVKSEDEVIIIGNQKGKTIDANKIAIEINTINHEILARLNPLLPKQVV